MGARVRGSGAGRAVLFLGAAIALSMALVLAIGTREGPEGAGTRDEPLPGGDAGAMLEGGSAIRPAARDGGTVRSRADGDVQEFAPEPRVVVEGKVVLRGASESIAGWFVIDDPARGQARASGKIGEDGRFRARLHVPSHERVDVVHVVLPGLAVASKEVVVPTSGTVQVRFELDVPTRLHGIVTDEAGTPVPDVRFAWVARGTPVSLEQREADPSTNATRWLEMGRPGICTTDANGRFRVAGIDPATSWPISTQPDWHVSLEEGHVGTTHDPLVVRATANAGIILTVFDAATGAAIGDLEGWCLLSIGGEVAIQGVMGGEDGTLQMVTTPDARAGAGRAALLLLAPGRLPYRTAIDWPDGRRVHRARIRLPPGHPSVAPRSVQIADEALARFREGAFVFGRRVMTLSDGGHALRIEELLEQHEPDALPPGTHRFEWYLDRVRSASTIAPWRVEIDVPIEGEVSIDVRPPQTGSLRLSTHVEGIGTITHVDVEGPDGRQSGVKALRHLGTPPVLQDVPAGRCVVTRYTRIPDGLLMRDEVPVEIVPDQEATLSDG